MDCVILSIHCELGAWGGGVLRKQRQHPPRARGLRPFPLSFLPAHAFGSPKAHKSLSHTTLQWDFCQLRKNKPGLNDFKALLSRVCPLHSPQNYPEMKEERRKGTAGAPCPLQRVSLSPASCPMGVPSPHLLGEAV